MKLIINAEITKGYETWKNLFLSVDHIREKYGVKVLAYGHPKENEGKVYQVLEVPSHGNNARSFKRSRDSKIKNRCRREFGFTRSCFLSWVTLNI